MIDIVCATAKLPSFSFPVDMSVNDVLVCFDGPRQITNLQNCQIENRGYVLSLSGDTVGSYKTRAKALACSKSDYVLLLDDDVLASIGKIILIFLPIVVRKSLLFPLTFSFISG